METLETIRLRHSVRRYTKQLPEEEKVQNIIEAAKAAPVGMGQYKAMHITVVQDPATLEAVTECGKALFGRDLIYGAPTLVLVSAIPSDKVPGMEKSSVATIVQNMMLAATDQGLGSVYLLAIVAAVAQNPEMMQRLQIPEGFIPTAGMALGYADAAQPSVPHDIAVTRI